MLRPSKTEFESLYYRNATRITDAEYKKMHDDAFSNNKCGGFTEVLDCNDVIMCVKEPYNEDDVAHEILHVANRILLTRGVTPDFDNDEPQAYLVSLLTKYYYDYLGELAKQDSESKQIK